MRRRKNTGSGWVLAGALALAAFVLYRASQANSGGDGDVPNPYPDDPVVS